VTTSSTPTGIADLVTGAEAARRLGVSRERLRQLAARPGFPPPLGQLGRATVWRDADVAEWARQSGRDYRTG
jgi:predicted DNA-binding transcriptional regulator AlpA